MIHIVKNKIIIIYMIEKIAIIMAGGLGKRMCSDLPKVIHEINGKPMLVHVIEQTNLINPKKILS